MPLKNLGWEMLITRQEEQQRGKRIRTVGTYRVFHDGVPTELQGWTAESRGPGDNKVYRSGKCIEKGRYFLSTQDGTKFVTIGYSDGIDYPYPGIELGETGNRREILIHPGKGFLFSIGCIDLSGPLPDAWTDIDWTDSRRRVIQIIDDLREFAGEKFPSKNGFMIPGAFVVIEEKSNDKRDLGDHP